VEREGRRQRYERAEGNEESGEECRYERNNLPFNFIGLSHQ
jgi:hypothetical protein